MCLAEYSNTQFFEMFRMEKETFKILVDIIQKADDNKISKPYTGGHHLLDIPSYLLIFLWYMAVQDTLIGIGKRFNVSPTTVMNVVNKIRFLLLKLKKQFIKSPSTDKELLEVYRAFKNYPGVVRALDGTHIFIKVEKNQQECYVDRYRRHSMISK
ncbi:unnamed protein product [Psylliodes chrysocephalus]|uniref:Uncharacterized protein n=1 Tax=Psylliodes chrysocephalus TaxID=3402493 RepID=A0A9P0GDM5_9CUCU|nr:unnamed protein product [Psylliodes chrysocephala]